MKLLYAARSQKQRADSRFCADYTPFTPERVKISSISSIRDSISQDHVVKS
jgi:hypothetical protein